MDGNFKRVWVCVSMSECVLTLKGRARLFRVWHWLLLHDAVEVSLRTAWQQHTGLVPADPSVCDGSNNWIWYWSGLVIFEFPSAPDSWNQHENPCPCGRWDVCQVFYECWRFSGQLLVKLRMLLLGMKSAYSCLSGHDSTRLNPALRFCFTYFCLQMDTKLTHAGTVCLSQRVLQEL